MLTTGMRTPIGLKIHGDDVAEIEKTILADDLGPAKGGGTVAAVEIDDAYIEHILTYVDRGSLGPLKLVVNAGNGGAGAVIIGGLYWKTRRLEAAPAQRR